MDIERVLRNTPATLTVTFYGDETPVDADGAVAVVVEKADGTELTTGTATHEGIAGSGQYSFDLAAQANLNHLTVTWSGTFSAVAGSITTEVEIVGGFYFTLAELRASDAALVDPVKYPTTKLIDARHKVEYEFERYCERAFVPRFFREAVTGNGTDTIYVQKRELTTMLTVDGVAPTIDYYVNGLAIRTADGSTWTNGTVYTIEYEYGMAGVPVDLKDAALRRAKGRLVSARARIDERATLMQVPDFGTFHLATAGKDRPTGVPDIDVVLNDYRLGGWGVV